ncbi:MAG: glutamate racemase [Bacteroidetes bacterium GWC2_33_15]|nr:MAG: glutamate racemase [Bacteroidetes bacterium GWA2_33_15]OFX51673.1 MAG: glutamate racemase [Bacteroidetes bacterium GWC2_33_15]OFX66265.1 MAG: glutamate racemase [Bacteroidetes bacterium GWB2_32_14]OFX66973.1 MAG: glutamate racemase [Bacteroidetes bacterium GWD2_33_33]HAN17671.1 glutamate racemase [Bacteroidales bacterium]
MNKPIGIFDSGVGGLSVWRHLVKDLPNESVVYFADTANCPYGPKSQPEIIAVVDKVVRFLISKNVKLIVVACNTATAAAIDYLRATYNIPFIGMEPAVKPAALNSKTKSIAVLATEGTFNGKLYIETSQRFASDVDLHIKIGDKLVDIVEKNQINNSETENHVKELMAPLIQKNIDHLVLGCTHYPFLTEVLKKVLPAKVHIIDPAPAVIKQTSKILEENNLLSNNSLKPVYEFYSSGESQVLQSLIFNITNKKYIVKSL